MGSQDIIDCDWIFKILSRTQKGSGNTQINVRILAFYRLPICHLFTQKAEISYNGLYLFLGSYAVVFHCTEALVLRIVMKTRKESEKNVRAAGISFTGDSGISREG